MNRLRQTGRQILTLCMALMICVSFSPAWSHAAGKTADKRIKAPETIRGVVICGKVTRGLESDVTVVKQALMESLDAVYSTVKKRSYYHQDVWTEINRTYNDARNQIVKARKMSDLISGYILGLAVIDEKLSQRIEMLSSLASLTKQKYNGRGDFPALQKKLRAELKESKQAFSRKDYNDYYWDVYLDSSAEVEDLIAAMTDKAAAKRLARCGVKVKPGKIETYIAAQTALFAFRDMDIADVVEDAEEELEEEEDEELEALEEEDFYSSLPWMNIEWPYSAMYTKAALAKMRKDYKALLKRYAKEALPAYGYKGKAKSFDPIIRRCVKEMARTPDAENICRSVLNAIDRIDKKSGIRFDKVREASRADKIRMRDRMKDYFVAHYREKDYSEKGWKKLKKVLKDAQQQAADASVDKQLNTNMFRSYQKNLRKVPTLAQENASALKKARKAAVKKLRSYRNARFYRQKTAAPLVDKALAAVKKCTSAKQVKKTLKAYTARLDKTQIRCRISTSAEGKGKITRNRTVRKGHSVKIRIKARGKHRIKELLVDGKPVERAVNLKKYTCKFRKVSKDHDVRVEFY